MHRDGDSDARGFWCFAWRHLRSRESDTFLEAFATVSMRLRAYDFAAELCLYYRAQRDPLEVARAARQRKRSANRIHEARARMRAAYLRLSSSAH